MPVVIRTRPRVSRVAAAGAGAVVFAGCLVTASPAAYAGPPGDCAAINSTDTPTDPYEQPSAPLEDLQIDKAHKLFGDHSPGDGVVVAVLDSGIVANRALPVIGQQISVFDSKIAFDDAFAYYHGSAVAGLIAGAARPDGKPVGIAPGARLLDVRVYDAGPDQPADDHTQLTTERLVEGLNRVHELGNIDIVNISLAVERSKELKAAIDRVTDDGIIVVASSGNRPVGEADPLYSEFQAYKFGEDAATTVYPAGYALENKRVIAVNSTVPSGEVATDSVLQNSAVTVAVPTELGVSYGVNQQPCFLGLSATSYAAAEVSGVLALLIDRFEKDTADQIVARLTDTAAGSAVRNPIQPDKLTGLGIVQPYDALTRLVDPDKSGGMTRGIEPAEDPTPAALPEPEKDVLTSTREDAVWWGLIGGGALIVAVLLRPVFARRRPADPEV